MFIDNQQSSSRWTLSLVLTFTIPIALLLWGKFDRSDYVLTQISIFGLSVYETAYILGCLGLLAHIIILLINPSYIYFSDEGKNIVLRTCSSMPVFRKFREYPFPKKSLKNYTYRETLFGLKKTLSITVSGLDPQTREPKTFSIESINISALKKKNIEGLIKALDNAMEK